ncbi:glycosylated lysosomal membrane protein [Discoglossus pictus]
MCAGLWLALLGALCAGARSEEAGRRVSLEFNPGFPESSVNLLHIRAVGSGSTIHYVWSTMGAPTVLLIYTDSEQSHLTINWTKLISQEPYGAIDIEPEGSVRYSTALLFTRLFEYQDVNNTANFSGIGDIYFYPSYDLSNFQWENANATLNSSALSANLTGHSKYDPTGRFENGSLAFRVQAYKNEGRDASSPHLLHSANCSKLELLLDGVLPRGNNSRFALEMVTLEKKHGRKKMDTVHSIDDEYTPTIFEMVQLVSDSSNASYAQGFFQWKSVAYGSAMKSRDVALPVKYHQLQSLNRTLVAPNIAHAFYGEHMEDTYNMEAFNISFGMSGGDFYDKRKYLSWSALVGYGTPPKDSFSVLVLCIVAVALGTPMVLLIIGGIVIVVLKKRVYSNYQPIN